MTLEQLLNKLIDLGWEPRGNKYPDDNYIVVDAHLNGGDIFIEFEAKSYSLNDLCSIESGLRQFVCEYSLYNITEPKRYDWYMNGIMVGTYMSNDWRYRAMMSANFPNKEKFLFSNISLGQTQQTE